MTRIHSAIFIFLYFGTEKTFAFLNKTEEQITTDLIDELNIRHLILIQDTDITSSDLSKLKNFTKWNIPIMYPSIAHLSKCFLKESFPDVNTLIVAKVLSIKILEDFYNELRDVSMTNFYITII